MRRQKRWNILILIGRHNVREFYLLHLWLLCMLLLLSQYKQWAFLQTIQKLKYVNKHVGGGNKKKKKNMSKRIPPDNLGSICNIDLKKMWCGEFPIFTLWYCVTQLDVDRDIAWIFIRLSWLVVSIQKHFRYFDPLKV